MKIKTKLALGCALLLLLLAAPSPAQKGGSDKQKFHTNGTFSNIKAGEGGDYGGIEVYLTDSDGQFYAAVTLAEGVLHAPVLVKAKVDVDSRKIEFSLPSEDAVRKFTGQVTADGMTLTEAGGEKHILKRMCY